MRIYIDPGHGGSDPGAVYKGRQEKADNLRLALAIRDKLLTQSGVEVKVSRTSNDVNPSLINRPKEANAWGADYVLCLHRNAFKPNAAKGIECYILRSIPSGGVDERYVTAILNAVVANSGLSNRGVRRGTPYNSDYWINLHSDAPSALFEVGFIDSDGDNSIFDSKFNAIAEAFAKTIIEMFGKTWGQVTPTPPEVLKDVQRLQIGPWGSIESLASGLIKLKSQGYETMPLKDGTQYYAQIGAYSSTVGLSEAIRKTVNYGHAYRIVKEQSGYPISVNTPSAAPNLTTQFKRGDRIKVNTAVKDLNTGRQYANFVYATTYTIMDVWSDNTVSFGDGKSYVGRVRQTEIKKV